MFGGGSTDGYVRRIIDDGSDASDDDVDSPTFLKSTGKRSATDFLVEVCFYFYLTFVWRIHTFCSVNCGTTFYYWTTYQLIKLSTLTLSPELSRISRFFNSFAGYSFVFFLLYVIYTRRIDRSLCKSQKVQTENPLRPDLSHGACKEKEVRKQATTSNREEGRSEYGKGCYQDASGRTCAITGV